MGVGVHLGCHVLGHGSFPLLLVLFTSFVQSSIFSCCFVPDLHRQLPCTLYLKRCLQSFLIWEVDLICLLLCFGPSLCLQKAFEAALGSGYRLILLLESLKILIYKVCDFGPYSVVTSKYHRLGNLSRVEDFIAHSSGGFGFQEHGSGIGRMPSCINMWFKSSQGKTE